MTEFDIFYRVSAPDALKTRLVHNVVQSDIASTYLKKELSGVRVVL